jgi:two-component sensor histidine kinase
MLYAPQSLETSQALAYAVMDSAPDPLAVLDERHCLLTASQTFFDLFGLNRDLSEGRPIYSLGEGQLDRPDIRLFLSMVSGDCVVAPDVIEVEQSFPTGRRRVMALFARRLGRGDEGRSTLVLTFTDITIRQELEQGRTALLLQTSRRLRDKDIQLREVQHRIGNNIQMLAAILRIQCRNVESEEVRYHLRDAYLRVMSVGQVQSHLCDAENLDVVEVSSYLADLAGGLGASMVSDRQPIQITARAANGPLASTRAVRIGLAVTELVINAIKFAFPVHKPDAQICIDYETHGENWKLLVSDNGLGNGAGQAARTRGSLARTIVYDLVKQLDARMTVSSGPEGFAVSIMSPNYVML